MYFIGLCKGQYDFLLGDSEALYKKNLSTMPEDWFWRNGPKITYNINEQGFRMNKHLNDVDFDNYCVSLGCSYAFGQGMPYDDLYSVKIAKKYKTDLVLMGSPGHGIDTFFHNFFLLIDIYKKLPKFVLIAQSSLERKTYWINDEWAMYTPENIHRKERRKSYMEFLKHEANYFYDFQSKRSALINFLYFNRIPYLEFTGFFNIEIYDNLLKIPNLNVRSTTQPLARDHQYYNGKLATHPGFEYQKNVINMFDHTVGKLL